MFAPHGAWLCRLDRLLDSGILETHPKDQRSQTRFALGNLMDTKGSQQGLKGPFDQGFPFGPSRPHRYQGRITSTE